jgi:Cysteine-rich secretory protein family
MGCDRRVVGAWRLRGRRFERTTEHVFQHGRGRQTRSRGRRNDDFAVQEEQRSSWRRDRSGYPATLAVENVSAGYHTLAEAFSGWRDSPPHRANMLQNGVTKMGIAASYAPNTKYKVFWTLILASTEPRDTPGIRLPSTVLAN